MVREEKFPFQSILLAWTILMIVVLCYSTSGTRQRTQKQIDAGEISPEEAESQMNFNICCPFGLWVLLAVPFGIAAIATLPRTKNS